MVNLICSSFHIGSKNNIKRDTAFIIQLLVPIRFNKINFWKKLTHTNELKKKLTLQPMLYYIFGGTLRLYYLLLKLKHKNIQCFCVTY